MRRRISPRRFYHDARYTPPARRPCAQRVSLITKDIDDMIDRGELAIHVLLPESKRGFAPRTAGAWHYALTHLFSGREEWLVAYEH